MPDTPRSWVARVTGAARGIGATTALRLAQDGLRVAVLDLEESAPPARLVNGIDQSSMNNSLS